MYMHKMTTMSNHVVTATYHMHRNFHSIKFSLLGKQIGVSQLYFANHLPTTFHGFLHCAATWQHKIRI